jgi:uncharacterized protein YndB with AHSA1/START domain
MMQEPKRRPPLRFERTLPAPPEEAFRAWTDPESLAVWMRPGEIRRAEAHCDLRVGGHYEITMKGDESEYVQRGEYLEIDPPKRLVFPWFSDALPETRTLITVELAPTGDGETRLTLVHEDIPESPAYEGYEGGWGDILRRLTDHVGEDARRS